MAFSDFTAGDVFTAADADVLMRQSIMRFDDASARDTALSGVLAEGMHCYLEDTNSLTYYTGSQWRSVYSAWTSFTPSWANLTVGDGTVTAHYRYVAGDLRIQATVEFGSTTEVTAALSMTLPNSESSASSIAGSIGSAVYVNASTSSTKRQAFVFVGSASSSATFTRTGGGDFDATDPWSDGGASGDQLWFDITVAL